jgi:membrane fusion protein (multidrug efflux system)
MSEPVPDQSPIETPAPKEAPSVAKQPTAPRARRSVLRTILLLLGPLVVAVAGAYIYFTGGRFVSTDNAYLQADKVAISAEVAGPVKEVLVQENAPVTRGQALFRIDDRPYRVAVDHAQAALAKARTDVAATEASYREQRAQLAIANTNLAFAEREYARQTELAQKHFISAAKLDDARKALDLARQQEMAGKQALERIAASLGGKPDLPVDQNPSVREARAALAQAELDLARTEVRAPFAGLASTPPRVGQYLTPGTPAMAVVADARVWVEANFTETDLTYVAPGQPATVTIDTYPGHKWHGTVQSVSPATGAQFAILPPQNATGNWVKVVQRIPVRIALALEPDDPQLIAGMSAEVEIDTKHQRALPWLAHAASPPPPKRTHISVEP